LKRNWKRWKGKQSGRRRIEIIAEEEEVEKEKPGVREWIKEDNNKMGNMVNPYYKL